MADQFQTGICGENWGITSRSTFGSSLYTTPINDTGNFGWPSDLESGSGTVLMDSTWQMMGSSLSSPATTSCNKTSHGSTAESNYHHPILQGDINSMSSASLDYPSKLLQTLFAIHSQSQNSLSDKPSMINPSTQNYQTKLNDFSHSLPQLSPLLEPLMPKLEKPNYPNLPAKSCHEDVQYSSSVVNEPELKRPQIETPSPLPTFKVRKQKIGDQITALHQLVSPFGKTDTTSVLSEAIEYIKFLHEQVNVLSTPYMKIGAPIQHQKTSDKLKVYPEGRKQDLRSRGLCLVPVSTSFPIQPVVSNTTADFRMQMGSSSTNATKLENLKCRPQTCNCGLNTVMGITESDGNNNKGRSYYGCPNQKCMYWNWSKPIPLDEISSTSSIKQPLNQKVAKRQVPELDMFSKLRSQNVYFSQRLQGFEASHRLMKRVVFATMMLSIVAIIIGVIGLIGK